MFKETVIPWMKSVAMDHASPAGVPAKILLQQDSAPAHRSHKTLKFLREEKNPFWSPEQWPPNSPDLNPLDYAIWAIVSQRACKTRPKSVRALKTKVSKIWKDLDPAEIRKICRRFRARLERCVAENGSFFIKMNFFQKTFELKLLDNT